MSDTPQPVGGGAPPPPTGTIDITNLVASIEDTWVRWAVAYVMAAMAANPWLSWTALPIISTILELLIHLVIARVSQGIEMQAFFFNTAVRKAAQAQDFIAAKHVLLSLPPSASYKEYANAEKVEMAAFRNFVLVTN